MDLEKMIRKFAHQQKVKPEDFTAFREKLLAGLGKLHLSQTDIDLEQYKKFVNELKRKKP